MGKAREMERPLRQPHHFLFTQHDAVGLNRGRKELFKVITSIELSRCKMIACVAAPMWPRSGDTPVGSSAWLDTAPGLLACEWSVHALDTPPAHARTHSLTV